MRPQPSPLGVGSDGQSRASPGRELPRSERESWHPIASPIVELISFLCAYVCAGMSYRRRGDCKLIKTNHLALGCRLRFICCRPLAAAAAAKTRAQKSSAAKTSSNGWPNLHHRYQSRSAKLPNDCVLIARPSYTRLARRKPPKLSRALESLRAPYANCFW